jgi:hypothetical protein
MRNSIVNIESISNNSFGTGFVIDRDEKGVFVLTCAHVLDDVETPVVENVLAKVVAKGSFIDMAVLYVSKLKVDALPLQTQECTNLNVEVIGFSVFNKNLTQKKHIKATLYQELIELHSKEDDLFYTVRKIKANDGFNFDRGNSGSPVICKDSGNVIAMISNKEGSDIGYAIDIKNIKEVWKEIPKKLLETKVEPQEQEEKIEPVSGRKEESTPLKTPPPKKNSNASMGKYLLGLLLIAGLGFGVYKIVGNSHPTPPIIHRPPPKPISNVSKLEQMALQALIRKEYKHASVLFDRAYRLNPKYHNLYEINKLLKKYSHRMNENIIRNMVLRRIVTDLSWGIPKETLLQLKKQIRN